MSACRSSVWVMSWSSGPSVRWLAAAGAASPWCAGGAAGPRSIDASADAADADVAGAGSRRGASAATGHDGGSRRPRWRRTGRIGIDLARRAGQLVEQRELAELEHQRPEVAGVEQLDVEVRVELAQAAELAVLLADELLAERRHLEVQVEVRQVEVRREALDDVAVEVPEDREGVRLVLPADLRRSRGSAPSPPRSRGRTGTLQPSTTDPRRSPTLEARSSQPTRSPSQASRSVAGSR